MKERNSLYKDEGEIMWKSKYLTGIKFIDDQHKHLNELSADVRQLASEGRKDEVLNRLDNFFYYLMFHFEYENKLMQSREYPMYYDHYMAHSSILSEVLDGMETVISHYEHGIEKLTKTFDKLYENHLKAFDQDLSKFERQSLPQKFEDYYHVANGQLIFFSKMDTLLVRSEK